MVSQHMLCARSLLQRSTLGPGARRDGAGNLGQRSPGIFLGLPLVVATLLVVLLPSEGHAHHAEWMKGQPFIQGLSMPIHGVDHMLVAVGVGLIAVQLGGSALWWVPSLFGLLMWIGGLLNVHGIAVPPVELGILASILVLGATGTSHGWEPHLQTSWATAITSPARSGWCRTPGPARSCRNRASRRTRRGPCRSWRLRRRR